MSDKVANHHALHSRKKHNLGNSGAPYPCSLPLSISDSGTLFTVGSFEMKSHSDTKYLFKVKRRPPHLPRVEKDGRATSISSAPTSTTPFITPTISLPCPAPSPSINFSFNPGTFSSGSGNSPTTSFLGSIVSTTTAPAFSSLPLAFENFQFKAESVPEIEVGRSEIGQEVTDKENKMSSQMGILVPLETKQNKANQEDNIEPLSYSPLPLIMVTRILKGIPQSPHFLQFKSHFEMAKKNLICAWDRTFEETVEEIQSLQVVDFWVRVKKLWKTMEELQSLGYNVIVLRKRLVELTDVMGELKLSELEIKGLKNKAEFHRMEKSRLEFVILNFHAQAEREQGKMEELLSEVAEMEKKLPKFDGIFAKVAMAPFVE